MDQREVAAFHSTGRYGKEALFIWPVDDRLCAINFHLAPGFADVKTEWDNVLLFLIE